MGSVFKRTISMIIWNFLYFPKILHTNGIKNWMCMHLLDTEIRVALHLPNNGDEQKAASSVFLATKFNEPLRSSCVHTEESSQWEGNNDDDSDDVLSVLNVAVVLLLCMEWSCCLARCRQITLQFSLLVSVEFELYDAFLFTSDTIRLSVDCNIILFTRMRPPQFEILFDSVFLFYSVIFFSVVAYCMSCVANTQFTAMPNEKIIYAETAKFNCVSLALRRMFQRVY